MQVTHYHNVRSPLPLLACSQTWPRPDIPQLAKENISFVLI